MASNGTTGETEALTAVLSDFSLHSVMAAKRTASLPDIEKRKRINAPMSCADGQNDIPHSILITVKASVALATGQAANGKMATTNRADPLSKDLVLTATENGAGATYKFSRLKQKGTTKGGEFVSASFRLAFGAVIGF